MTGGRVRFRPVPGPGPPVQPSRRISASACARPLSAAMSSSDCASRTVAKVTGPSCPDPSSGPATARNPYTAGRGRLLYAHGVEK